MSGSVMLPIRGAAGFLGGHPGTRRGWGDDRLTTSYRVGRRRDWRLYRSDREQFLTGEREPWSAMSEASAS